MVLEPTRQDWALVVSHKYDVVKNFGSGTFLVVQKLKICLPMLETQVWSLVWEDPMPWGNKAHVLQLTEPARPRACTLQQEKPP